MRKPFGRFGSQLVSLWWLPLCATLVFLGLWYWLGPTKLTIAVADGPEEQIMRALAEKVKVTRQFNIQIVKFTDVRAAAEALERKRVDMGVVQPDVMFPNNGGTVAIFREEFLIVLSPAKTKVDEAGKLASKRILIATRGSADSHFANKVLTHYHLTTSKTQVAEITTDQLHKIPSSSSAHDAMIFLAAPGSRHAREMVTHASRILGSELDVVPLRGASAFAETAPSLTEGVVKPGTLGLLPELPKDEVTTLSSSYRLVALLDLDRPVVSRLTETLFQHRQAIARAEPNANLMKAPSDDDAMSAPLPNHLGALDYFKREQLTFMDRYGDWLWLALFATGGLTSIFGWLSERMARRRRETTDIILDRLQTILSEARAAANEAELNELRLEVDKLVSNAVLHARKKTGATRTMSALMLSFDAARHAIDDQQRQLNRYSSVRSARRIASRP